MIKYALDLVAAENEVDDVFLLLPGKISINRKKRSCVEIYKDGLWKRVPVYRIKNPLPIPMANGILDIERYTVPCNETEYYIFLNTLAPDVIHIHTFMGLHSEFIDVAAKLRIPIIYTAHDFFGICPTAHMMCGNSICQFPGTKCKECSQQAFSEARNVLEQSSIYFLYRKNSTLIRIARSFLLKRCFLSLRSFQPHKQRMTAREEGIKRENVPVEEEYHRLLEYYKKMFDKITGFHFSSSLVCEKYEKHLGMLEGEIISISNREICDNRKTKKYNNILRLGYLGGNIPVKGLDKLQQAVSELYSQGFKEIELHIYGSTEVLPYDFFIYHKAYLPDQIEEVFDGMDVLVVPSCGIETFGMVVLEAISFGVPVIMTEKVGARDILLESQLEIGIIVKDNINDLKTAIMNCYVHRDKLEKMNQNILQEKIIFSYQEHVKRIRQMYLKYISRQADNERVCI